MYSFALSIKKKFQDEQNLQDLTESIVTVFMQFLFPKYNEHVLQVVFYRVTLSGIWFGLRTKMRNRAGAGSVRTVSLHSSMFEA